MKRCLQLTLGILALAAFVGCRTTEQKTEWIPPFTSAMETPEAYRVEALAAVRRVALLPTWGGDLVRETELAQVDAAVRRALQSLNQFEVIVVSRADMRGRFGNEAYSAAGLLPATLLQRVFLGVNSIDIMNFGHETGQSSGPNSVLGHSKLRHVSKLIKK